jgi:hypothetical protein
MLARSPDDRLASAAEVRDQMDPALALGGWDPRVITAPSASRTPANGIDESTQPTQPIPRQRMGTRSIVTGASMVVALAIAGVTLVQLAAEASNRKRRRRRSHGDTTHMRPRRRLPPRRSSRLPAGGTRHSREADTTPKTPVVAARIRYGAARSNCAVDSNDEHGQRRARFPNRNTAANARHPGSDLQGVRCAQSGVLPHAATQTGSKSEMPFEIA